jgi:hypothetical protein
MCRPNSATKVAEVFIETPGVFHARSIDRLKCLGSPTYARNNDVCYYFVSPVLVFATTCLMLGGGAVSK